MDASGNQLAAGVAALAICESLLLALADLKLVSTKEVQGLLADAAAAHDPEQVSSEFDRQIAAKIGGISAHIRQMDL